MVCHDLQRPHLQEGGKHDVNFGRPCQRHNLRMRVKGPHNHMVMALGLCVMWPQGHALERTCRSLTILIIIYRLQVGKDLVCKCLRSPLFLGLGPFTWS